MSLDYHVKDRHMSWYYPVCYLNMPVEDEELNIKEFTNDLATLYHITHHVNEQNIPVGT